ncbi:MAG: response regulator [Planctomycetes bacterium]|nr:response regulator [Planctomycetota bacterium]
MATTTFETSTLEGISEAAAIAGGDLLTLDSEKIADRSSASVDATARIMIVDDEPINIKVVRKYLQQLGYETFITTTESDRAIAMIRREAPDVLLLDVMMPKNGLDILHELRQDEQTAHLPVIILTAATDRETKLRALELGATDFLAKPVDSSELAPRVRNALVVRSYQNYLAGYAERLEQAVEKRTAELAASRLDVIHCLARAAEFRDDDTGQHVLRVGRYAGIIAGELGINAKRVDLIEHAAQLHDVGKIGIPDEVLLSPNRLEPEQFEVMKKHCGFGKKIIQRMSDDDQARIRQHVELGAKLLDVPSSPILELASSIALTHHEWFDGNGYPLGLAGEDIPLEGRITAVADVFDALSSKRPYKPAFPLQKCFEIMESERGTHFDPMVLDAFLLRRKEIVEIQMQHIDVD